MKSATIKKYLILVCAVIVFFVMTGCSKYVSKYKAIGFVHSNKVTSAYMSFISFDGCMIFKLKSSGEGDLNYSASLENGNATVYYDYNGKKCELFSIHGGEVVDSHGGYVDTGTIYVIVETDGECKGGDFHFNLN